MPSFGLTPEVLLGRNDSRNPASTCKGLTASGRPCRRVLAASHKSSPIGGKRIPSALGGVVAIVKENGDGEEREAVEFYCWQHKDQAERRLQGDAGIGNGGRRIGRRETEFFPLKERSSIDTMVQRLGLEAVPEENRKRTGNPRPQGRTEAVDYAPLAWGGDGYGANGMPARRKPQKKKAGFWASLCCMSTVDEDDYVEIVRHRKRTEPAQRSEMANAVSAPARIPTNTKPTDSRRPSNTSTTISPRNPLTTLPLRPTPQHGTSSNTRTKQLLSLIPPYLSPQTTSTLLAELVKPLSPHDDEGYIYIFWLTPQSRQAPGEETVRSLLAPPTTTGYTGSASSAARPQHERRISDVMTEYSFDGSEIEARTPGVGNGSKTIMLKIGRANNVTRRMNEWQRQCGYALNLVRWYPHVPSSPHPSPQPSPSRQQPLYPDLARPPTHHQRRESESVNIRKVPYVKRVERLIHLELQEQKVKRQCGACGKEHREWFEVEASQVGVRGVDECLKRWVGWAEGQGRG